MSGADGQLALGLGHPPALSRADFVPGACNREALAAIDAWQDWHSGCLLLTGPQGSGKTHLVKIWTEQNGGGAIAADQLGDDGIALDEGGVLAVEDIDRTGGENALFHLLNLARERQASILLSARDPELPTKIVLPDLASRLRAARPARLLPPDDDFLRRVLVKLLADRQLFVSRPLMDYLMTRMERTFAAAALLVSRLDQAALATGRPLSRQLAGPILADLAGENAAVCAEEAK